jgi:hypothetical protein
MASAGEDESWWTTTQGADIARERAGASFQVNAEFVVCKIWLTPSVSWRCSERNPGQMETHGRIRCTAVSLGTFQRCMRPLHFKAALAMFVGAGGRAHQPARRGQRGDSAPAVRASCPMLAKPRRPAPACAPHPARPRRFRA